MSSVFGTAGLRLFLFFSFALFAARATVAAQGNDRSALAAADAAMQAGRYDDAARGYAAWTATHPDAKEVLFALGLCYVQLGRSADAVTTLRRYVKLVPDSAPGHAALGVALLDGPGATAARAELETAVRLDAKQSDAVETLARLDLIEGKAAEAAARLGPLVAAGGSDETRAMLADAMIRSGQAAAAAEMLERRIDADAASSARIYGVAAWARLKAGDTARAAELCERGMRRYPDSEIVAVYLSLPGPLLAERLGARIKAMQDAPEPSELVAIGRVLIEADTAGKTRANEIGERLLAHAVQLAPENVSARYNYGRALAVTSTPRALEVWEKALALNPEADMRMRILLEIGGAHQELGEGEAAERAYKAALEVFRSLPDRDPEPMLEYARFLVVQARPAEADALLDELVRRNPLSPEANLERARVDADRGQWEKVVDRAEFVLRSASADDDKLQRGAHVLLARAYLHLNKPERAEAHRAWLAAH